MSGKFRHPSIVGIIGADFKHSSLEKKITRFFKRKRLNFVCLQLSMEPKYLKNVVMCMKLMDVAGMYVMGKYSKKIAPFLDSLDISAKKAGAVNFVARSKKKFIGYYAVDMVEEPVRLLTRQK